MEIWGWMKTLEDRVENEFGERLVCLGLQGSYARGEATEESNIDAVLILDEVSMDDLHRYYEILKWLPHRDKVCGFVAGKREFVCWEKAELFQFCRDTDVIRGSLDFAMELVDVEDVKRAVRAGACSIYRGAVHGMMHKRLVSKLPPFYKKAFFVLQAHFFVQTGLYIRSHRELAECLTGEQRQLLYDAIAMKNGSANEDFEYYAKQLMDVSSALIREYGETK